VHLELSGRIVALEAQLRMAQQESETAEKACSVLRADREERDNALRELLAENDGLQGRLRESAEAAARLEAVKQVDCSMMSDLKSQIVLLKSELDQTASLDSRMKLRLQQDLLHAQQESIDLNSRLKSSSQQLADLLLEKNKVDGSYQEMKAVLQDLVNENDRLTGLLNAHVTPGTPRAEKIVQTHAVMVQHKLLQAALRQFWDAVGDLPRLSNLSLEEHGIILEAVVVLQTYLANVNLLDGRGSLRRNPAFVTAFPNTNFGLSGLVDMSFSTPSSKYREIPSSESGSHASDGSPQRRNLFRSIVQRRS
jgi:DNA repair exonuclease SbcCD ATPase subunit